VSRARAHTHTHTHARTHARTLEQSRSYKSLEAHVQFTDGWVHDLKMSVPENCDNTVIKAKIRTPDLLGHVDQHVFVWPIILICKYLFCLHFNGVKRRSVASGFVCVWGGEGGVRACRCVCVCRCVHEHV